MEIIFTEHAKYRAENRNIMIGEIIDSIGFPDHTYKRHRKYYFRKKFERGSIEICCERTERYIKIITVYWV